MGRRKNPSPDWAVHPGEVVREGYQERGLTLTRFAAALGVSQSYVSDICNGRRAVSPRFALRLEKFGMGSADIYVRMQADHDLLIERRRVIPSKESPDASG